jgi:hypothetical protein
VAKLEAEVASLQAEVARVAERRAQTAESAGLPEDEWESEEKERGPGRRPGECMATQTKADGEAVKDDYVVSACNLTHVDTLQ